MRTLLLAVALCSLPALAADARKPTTLDSAFTPKLGDFIALEISAAFASLKTIDAPIIVGYDAEIPVGGESGGAAHRITMGGTIGF